jgi:hypothetical protein
MGTHFGAKMTGKFHKNAENPQTAPKQFFENFLQFALE